MKLGENGSAVVIGAMALLAVGSMGIALLERTKTEARLKQTSLIEHKAEELAEWLKIKLADHKFCTDNIASLGLAPNDFLDFTELKDTNGEPVLKRGIFETGVGDIEITGLKFREIEMESGERLPYFTIAFDLNPKKIKKLMGADHRQMNFLLHGPQNPDGSFKDWCFHEESTHVADTMRTACQNFGGVFHADSWVCEPNLGSLLSPDESEVCASADGKSIVVDENGIASIACAN